MSLYQRLISNSFIQSLLDKNVETSQLFMGIGSASEVNSSGEKEIFSILQKKYNSPYCIFDVGANKGQFLELAVQEITSNDYSIHCFEPSQGTFEYLLATTKKNKQIENNQHNITLNNIALGKEKTEATLFYDKVGSGLASLTKRELKHFNIDFNQSEPVKVETIDNYCLENNITSIHLLKLDIEGHELDALSGAVNMFSSNLIKIVTFEFGGCNIDTRTFFRDFWLFFNNYNFSIMRITPSGYLYPINSYREIYEQFRTTNFVAISRQ